MHRTEVEPRLTSRLLGSLCEPDPFRATGSEDDQEVLHPHCRGETPRTSRWDRGRTGRDCHLELLFHLSAHVTSEEARPVEGAHWASHRGQAVSLRPGSSPQSPSSRPPAPPTRSHTGHAGHGGQAAALLPSVLVPHHPHCPASRIHVSRSEGRSPQGPAGAGPAQPSTPGVGAARLPTPHTRLSHLAFPRALVCPTRTPRHGAGGSHPRPATCSHTPPPTSHPFSRGGEGVSARSRAHGT